MEGIDVNELKWRKTLSLTSLLDDGDQEVYDKCTVDEIMNPIGTMPKDGFIKKEEPEKKKSVSPPNKFSAKLSKPVAVPPPRKSQNPYLMELISSGAAAKTNEDAKDKQPFPVKNQASAFNGKKSPGANANRRGSPGATATNKRGSPDAQKQKAK